LFINAIKVRRGLGSNISLECCKTIGQNGVLAISSDAQILPFLEKSFDYVLCLELFEHVPNPVLLLQEMRRIIKKGIFISIPYAKTSRVCPKGYTKGWSKSEHIFELGVIDFKNLLSQVDLKVAREKYLCPHYPTKHLLKKWLRPNIPNWVLFEVRRR
jgi:ubiquinone/menaquinone biosynthesis C-methylase UbiE